jgi:hypothetical protein
MVLNPTLAQLDRPNFAKRNVQPPAMQYIGPEDLLLVQSMNSHATTRVEVRGRLLLPDNTVQPIRYVHTPNRDRSSRADAIPVGGGYLLSLMAVPDAVDVRRGQCFVTLGLTSGAATSNPATHVLAQDYLSSSEAMGWPGSPVHGSAEGVGNLRVIVGTQPAVGQEIDETVPTNARWRAIAMTAELVTSAAVGNRIVTLRAVTPGGVAAGWVSIYSHPAATLGDYVFGNTQSRQANAFGAVLVEIPPYIPLLQGWELETFTSGLQAGDQWSAPVLWVEEWLEE